MKKDFIVTTISVDELHQLILESVKGALDECLKSLKANDQPELLTRAQTAELLNASKPTLDTWCKSGILKKHRMGSKVFFKRSEIMECLSQKTQGQR